MMSRGPISDDIHELELELELLKRKRLMIQQQQQMLANEKYAQQRQHYEQPQPLFKQSYGLSQNQDTQFNFSHLYSNPQPSGSKFPGFQSTGQKRQSNDLPWQPSPPKRFNSGPKGKGKKSAQAKTLPSPWASNSNLQPLMASTFSRPQQQAKQPKQANYQNPKAQRRALIKNPPPLNIPQLKPQYPKPMNEENSTEDPLNPNNPYKKLSRQQIGKLEFVLGSVLKDVRKKYSESDLYSTLFRNDKTLRTLKQAIRDRLYSAMPEVKSTDKSHILYDKYRQIYPEETDQEIMDIALTAAKAVIREPTLAINIDSEESPAAFFKKNIDKLVYVKITEMFEKIQKVYEEENKFSTLKSINEKKNYSQNKLFQETKKLIDENLSFTKTFQVKCEKNDTIDLNDDSDSALKKQDKADSGSSTVPDKPKEKSDNDAALEDEKKKSDNDAALENEKKESDNDTVPEKENAKCSEKDTTLENQKEKGGENDTAIENLKEKSNVTVDKQTDNENETVVETKVNSTHKEFENHNSNAEDKETKLIVSAWKTLNEQFFRPAFYNRMLHLLLPHAINRALPQCKKTILKILQTDSQFVYTKEEIERRTSSLPSFNTDGSQIPTYKYYVKICGIPMLPLKQNMKRFLHKYNPPLVKKHRKFGNMLIVGFNNKDNFDELLKADGTSLGLIKLNITKSDHKPEKNDTEDLQASINKANDQETADDGTGNIMGKELDDKITDLLSSIREAEEAERNGKENANEIEFISEQREVISLIDDETDEAKKSTANDAVQVESDKNVENSVNKDNKLIEKSVDIMPEDVEMAPQNEGNTETDNSNDLTIILEDDVHENDDFENPTGMQEL